MTGAVAGAVTGTVTGAGHAPEAPALDPALADRDVPIGTLKGASG